MIQNDTTLKILDDKYNNLKDTYLNLYGKHGYFHVSIFIGTILLPLAIYLHTYKIYIPIFIYLLFTSYKANILLKMNEKLLLSIEECENSLRNNTELKYCYCSSPSHFYSPNNEKLYNIKSDILFDTHPNTRYTEWHISHKKNPEGRIQFYFRLSVILIVVNSLLMLLEQI